VALAELLAALERDGRAQEEQILAAARAAAARIAAEAAAARAARRAASLGAEESALRAAAAAELAAARRAADRAVLEARARLLARVFAAAAARLADPATQRRLLRGTGDLGPQEASGLRGRLAEVLALGPPAPAPAPVPAAAAAPAAAAPALATLRCAPAILAEVRALLAERLDIAVVPDAAPLPGLRLESAGGTLVVDDSLGARLERLRPELAIEVLRLTGEGT